MKITIIGGGPSGLYFAILMKKLDRTHEVTLLERDGPNDTFGWGIVFSDQTFTYLKDNDKKSFAAITKSCQQWENVDVIHKDQKVTIRGNKFSGIGRLSFLNILHKRCVDLGVDLRFETNVTDLNELPPSDLLVGADGSNSFVRGVFSKEFQPSIDQRKNRYIWLGTRQLFPGLTLIFREHEAGLFIAHAYKFNDSASTFIVECNETTWRNARFDWKSDPETCQYLAEVFRADLDGQPLLSNNFVRWLNFPLVKNKRWHHKNVVLLGDALHTAHFSIGSGTKLALEDAIALARCFKTGNDVEHSLAEFQKLRKPVVDEYQEAAYASLILFENAQKELHLDPIPFAYKLMTRSKKIDYENLKQRDPEFIAAYDQWKHQAEGGKKKAEVRKQKAEGGKQKAEVRGQKSEAGSQRSEVRGQKSEARSQKSEVRGQKSEVRGQKSMGARAHTGAHKTKVKTPKAVVSRHLSRVSSQKAQARSRKQG
ncbi:MAG TPA: FAD-dependent monooxygenase [Blastocatellia bacterium]|nr:FAD-dependent monooxygenase [Blastocatellia bacterium]